MPRGYEAAGEAVLLTWSSVEDRLERATNYWLATTRPDGRPHVTPIWGVWLEQALYFDGIPTALWARNMAENPAVTLHLESGTDVVILEGTGEDIASVSDPDLAARIVAAWDSKYGRLHPDPVTNGLFRFQPRTARLEHISRRCDPLDVRQRVTCFSGAALARCPGRSHDAAARIGPTVSAYGCCRRRRDRCARSRPTSRSGRSRAGH